jgi:hypothetical protein
MIRALSVAERDRRQTSLGNATYFFDVAENLLFIFRAGTQVQQGIFMRGKHVCLDCAAQVVRKFCVVVV